MSMRKILGFAPVRTARTGGVSSATSLTGGCARSLTRPTIFCKSFADACGLAREKRGVAVGHLDREFPDAPEKSFCANFCRPSRSKSQSTGNGEAVRIASPKSLIFGGTDSECLAVLAAGSTSTGTCLS
jgi:hypothetical protein